MATHDPRRFVEDLRSHLAAPDRHLGFLFGSGTSCSVRGGGGEEPERPFIPDLRSLTELCGEAVGALGKNFQDAWRALLLHCAVENREANVEDVLSNVRTEITAVGRGERLAGLDLEGLQLLEETICAGIARAVSPDLGTLPAHIPHDHLARWIYKMTRTAPLEIFTTNYDILLERALERARVPVFDGFVGAYKPFFFPECLEDETMLPDKTWVRLWKIHGSINWGLEAIGSQVRIVRGSANNSGSLILPSHRKYDESRKQPYVSFIERLGRVVSRNHGLLITCGYSFGDEHINAMLYGSLDRRGTSNIVALMYTDIEAGSPLVQAALRRPNLSIAGPNGAVIDATWGKWKLTEAVDERTHSFMDVAFDSNAAPEAPGADGEAHELTGRMRLGDFNWFSRFLQDMSAEEH